MAQTECNLGRRKFESCLSQYRGYARRICNSRRTVKVYADLNETTRGVSHGIIHFIRLSEKISYNTLDIIFFVGTGLLNLYTAGVHFLLVQQSPLLGSCIGIGQGSGEHAVEGVDWVLFTALKCWMRSWYALTKQQVCYVSGPESETKLPKLLEKLL
jgi:hypothetical protein